jgi:hypothetical protein
LHSYLCGFIRLRGVQTISLWAWFVLRFSLRFGFAGTTNFSCVSNSLPLKSLYISLFRRPPAKNFTTGYPGELPSFTFSTGSVRFMETIACVISALAYGPCFLFFDLFYLCTHSWLCRSVLFWLGVSPGSDFLASCLMDASTAFVWFLEGQIYPYGLSRRAPLVLNGVLCRLFSYH